MADPILLDVDIGGTDDAAKKFDSMIAQMVSATAAFNAALGSSTEEMEKLGETIEKLGQSSEEAGEKVEHGAKASAAAFNLLRVSAEGAVGVLTARGGISTAVSLFKELSESVEQTASHFGTLGKAIAEGAASFGLYAAGLGGVAAAVYELASHAAEATLSITSLAQTMGTSVAQTVQLRDRMRDFGLSGEEAGALFTRLSIRIQAAWQDIQNEIRDATSHIIQDQLAVAEAARNVEQAQVSAREAALTTAAAEEDASTAQADADRAHAEAVVNASEAVIHAKEAELDAQNKVADAQQKYQDAGVTAAEAQTNLADAQKDFQYSGEDAWRKMKDAIDAVADAERKAADEANAVQAAMLSVAEAATGVQSAYVSLYAAQLAYREAHGEGRITRQERAELRREQTEVGLQSAQERVQSAEFQYQRTARDAVPEAQERRARAERGVGAAREAEDKAQQQYAESSQRAADKLEKSGSAAADALERVARAALDVVTAPQRAADERTKAALGVQGAEAAERKTAFAATQAAAKAEDALETARINQGGAADKVIAAEIALTDARNKEVENFSNNIKNVLQYLRTGVLVPGMDRSQIRPQSYERAFQAESGGGSLAAAKELEAMRAAVTEGRLTIDELNAAARAAGIPLRELTRPQFQRQMQGDRPIIERPSEEQRQAAADIKKAEPGAESLEKAQLDAARALEAAATKWGNVLTGPVVTALTHPGEAIATGAAGIIVLQSILRAITASAAARATEAARIEARLAETAGPAKAAGAGLEGAISGVIVRGFMAANIGVLVAESIRGAITGITGHDVGDVHGIAAIDQMIPLLGKLDDFFSKIPILNQLAKSAAEQKTLAAEETKPAEAPEAPEAPEKPEAPKRHRTPEEARHRVEPEEAPEEPRSVAASGPASTRFAGAVAKFGEAVAKFGEITGAGGKDEKGGGGLSAIAAKLDEIVTRISTATEKSGESDSKLDDAAKKIDDAAGKLDDAANKIGLGAGSEIGGDKISVAADKIGEAADHLDQIATKLGGTGAAPVPAPGERTEEGAKDAIDKIKESIDKLVSGKGLIQPPTDPRERGAYDDAVRHLIEGLTQVNEAQKGLIQEQAKAIAENEKLTQKQEELVAAQTEKVKSEKSDEHELAQAQEGLIHAQTDNVQAQTNKITASTPTGRASGGVISGPGGVDNVPIMATSGEYVVNVPATSKHRSLLDQINAGGELHFQLGGYVGGLNPGLSHQPSTGALQAALTSNIGMGGGYMAAKMQTASTQSYAVDLRTDHGTYTVLATEDQMGTMLQGSIAAKIASTGTKPSWWS